MATKARSKQATNRSTKRASGKAETPLPVDAIPRAAERAGIEPKVRTIMTPHTPAAEQLAFLKDHLVRATDLVSESLAGLHDQESRESEYIDTVGIRDNLNEVLTALWQIRWECYATGGNVQTAEGGAS